MLLSFSTPVLFATYLKKCRNGKIILVWTHIHYKLNPLFLQTGPHNSLNSHYRLLTFFLKNSQLRTLHQFDYKCSANSMLWHFKEVSPLEDQAITAPKVNSMLNSIMQCFQGAHSLYYIDLCPLKAITCIPAVLVSLYYHCTHTSVQQQL